MSHGEIMRSLTGLLMAMFVSMLSSTVVSNALPRIVGQLHGGESAYTWVVTATLLTLTATTPIWGKLADQFSPKLLIQLSIVIYVAGSAIAGLSHNIGVLIFARAVQGVGAGGVTALAQTILAVIIPPRQRGRYSGYIGAVFAVATVLGPLAGGLIVDTSWLGWRWCFYVGIPFAAIALIMLQRTLHLVREPRPVGQDYLGITLLVGGVSLLLIWVSLAGAGRFGWVSTSTAWMVPLAVALLVLFPFAERRAAEPVVPLDLFRHRTFTLATIASVFIGIALFGATVFLSQFFQIAKGKTPTVSGLLSLPMVLGLFFSSLLIGRRITKIGKWKIYLTGGSVLLALGFALLSTIDDATSLPLIAVYMVITGVGMGATMQNLVLAVQNSVPMRQMGAATASVSFFRSLGGAIGVSALGAILGHRSSQLINDRLTAQGISGGAASNGEIPDVHSLPPAVARIVEHAYGQATGLVFLIAVPALVLAVIAIAFIREVPLRTTNTGDPEPSDRSAAVEGAAPDRSPAVDGAARPRRSADDGVGPGRPPATARWDAQPSSG
jgi:EmrB/QacA subfamily drug resistance transporter